MCRENFHIPAVFFLSNVKEKIQHVCSQEKADQNVRTAGFTMCPWEWKRSVCLPLSTALHFTGAIRNTDRISMVRSVTPVFPSAVWTMLKNFTPVLTLPIRGLPFL